MTSGFEQVEAAAEGSTTPDQKLTAAFAAYFDIVSERGTLLGELEQAMSARRMSPEGSDGTNELLAWLTSLIDQEFDVGPRRAMAYAAIVPPPRTTTPRSGRSAGSAGDTSKAWPWPSR